MHFQPRQYNPSGPIRITSDCKACYKAHLFAKDLFATVVTEVINEHTIGDTLSVDIRHHESPGKEIIQQVFPGKIGFSHTIRCFNHTRTEYLVYAGVQVIYRGSEHRNQCDYAKIIIDLSVRKKAPQSHLTNFTRLIDTLNLFSRKFADPGTTIVEKCNGHHSIDYLITTTVGKIEKPFATPSFHMTSAMIHNHKEERPMSYRSFGVTIVDDTSPERGSVNPIHHIKRDDTLYPSIQEDLYGEPSGYHSSLPESISTMNINEIRGRTMLRRGTH